MNRMIGVAVVLMGLGFCHVVWAQQTADASGTQVVKPAIKTVNYTVDSKRSRLVFVAHQSTGDTEGVFKSYSVAFSHDEGSLNNAKVRVKLVAKTIDTDSSGRDKHLRSKDFFDVTRYPYVTFKSTKVTDLGKGRWKIDGLLTIKQTVTRVSFPAKVSFSNDKKTLSVKAKLVVDRKKVGLTYKSPWYTPSIKNHVDIKMALVLNRS